MTFQTERVMEWWLNPLWASIPYPDGSTRLIRGTRQMWASYWRLLEEGHYSDEELADYADLHAEDLKLPYELAFSIVVQKAPPNPRLFNLPPWAKT